MGRRAKGPVSYQPRATPQGLMLKMQRAESPSHRTRVCTWTDSRNMIIEQRAPLIDPASDAGGSGGNAPVSRALAGAHRDLLRILWLAPPAHFRSPPGVQTGSAFTRESITDLCDQILSYRLCDSREGHPAIFKQCVFHIGAIHELDFQKALRHTIQFPVLRELMEKIGA